MGVLGSWGRGLFKSLKESIGGVFAITTTNFIELNIKRGQQFHIDVKSGPVAIGASQYWLFKTGPDPVILKKRVLKTNSNEVNWYVYREPIITGNGAARTIRNFNEVTPNTPAVQFFQTPTFSSKGPSYVIDYVPGAEGLGGRSTGGIGEEGYERILLPNRNYLIEIQNSGSNPMTYFLHLDWYEGPIKPLGDEELI